MEEPAVSRHHHNSWSAGRLVRQRSKATPMRNGQSHPQLLTLTSPAPNQTGMPHFSRPLREVGKRTPAAQPSTLTLLLHVWNGHSCPLPLTLILILILTLTLTLPLTLLVAQSQALSFRPERDPERSRRGRRSGGTRCPPAPPKLMERRTLRPSAEQNDAK